MAGFACEQADKSIVYPSIKKYNERDVFFPDFDKKDANITSALIFFYQ